VIVVLLAHIALPRPIIAQEKPPSTPSAGQPSGLGIRQQRVQRLVEEMDGKFKNLAQSLRASEPEKAERLVEALQQARTLHLAPRMKQVSDLLDGTRLDAASGEQKQLLADIERLLQLLLSEAIRREDDRAEREQLEAWRQEVRRLLEQQQALHGENKKLGDKNAPQPTDRPAALQALAKKQSQTGDETKKLADEMKKASQSNGKPDSPPKPGAAKVEQAQSAMQQAAECLGDGNCEGSGGKQQEAIKDLDKALQELEDRLKKMDEEDDAGPKIEARLREMLARQQPVTLATAETETRRGSDGMLRRADRLALGKLLTEEKSLATEAEAIQRMIEEEGRAVVFPEIVAQLKTDLESVAGRLEKQFTDTPTRELQRDIEATLQELIDALQAEAKKKKEESAGGQGSGGGKPPLLPGSAELKLLKSRQLRVNRRTDALETARQGKPLAAETQLELTELSRQQSSIEDLTQRLIDRILESSP